MLNFLRYTIGGWVVWSTLSVATIVLYSTTLALFARGDWHLGKRMLAATATIGFLLAMTIIVRYFTHG